MIINAQHRLQGDGVEFTPSPKQSGPFAAGLPDTIVMHYTAGASLESSVQTLCDPQVKASAHVVIGRDGRIVQLLPFDTIAWHAGKSRYDGRENLNRYSIGIEMDNAGRLEHGPGGYSAWFGRSYPPEEVFEGMHRNERTSSFWHRYSETQIETAGALCALLCEHYGIQQILGHEEIAPSRKSDPGPAFPLDKLRNRLLGDRSDNDVGTEALVSSSGTAVVEAAQLNIRSGPGLEHPRISEPLTRGTPLEVMAEEGEWLQVKHCNIGWVKRTYLHEG